MNKMSTASRTKPSLPTVIGYVNTTGTWTSLNKNSARPKCMRLQLVLGWSEVHRRVEGRARVKEGGRIYSNTHCGSHGVADPRRISYAPSTLCRGQPKSACNTERRGTTSQLNASALPIARGGKQHRAVQGRNRQRFRGQADEPSVAFQ
jgi:hypothetical protein